MFDFLIRKGAIRSAQRTIDALDTKVHIHVPPDLPLPSVKVIKQFGVRVARINALEADMEKFSDEQLRAQTDKFKSILAAQTAEARAAVASLEEQLRQVGSADERISVGEQLRKADEALYAAKQKALDGILEEAFATVREAGRRVLNMRHYDIQLVGGMVLHSGSIAEMTTGEGKTLVATAAVYLNALTGDGVHVVTVNDYLAGRDRDWMGPLYEFLGLTVGVIQHAMMPRERQRQYACDITYGTNNEFGFDYLRDNMVTFKQEMVQRRHHFAVVDEVDSILIDESRTPLIISGPAEMSTGQYYDAFKVSTQLKGNRITEADEIDAKHRGEDITAGYDYVADEKAKSISLTEQGEEKACELFGIDNMHDMDTIEYRHHILSALRAKEFFKRDTDYVVNDDQVIIVDEFTGRMMPGRRWSDGLHQAVEAKEGIKIERENQTLATITFQNYFRMYEKLAGMTGTAYTEANEFKTIYKLEVVVMPTNKPMQRMNYSDLIYRTAREKYEAVVQEIEVLNRKGQPVLVGTISIERSELLSRMLAEKGIPHKVLNAKFHEGEASIIAQAGRKGAVTIATNMAGRGTDIVLGGNAEFMAHALAGENLKEDADPEEKKRTIDKFLAQFKAQTEQEHKDVIMAGGLHVLGTERHESRRIDNQLRGRSGRQGDPGSSRFYVSLEDDLMRLFAGDRIKMIMDKLGMEEGQVIESPLVSRALETAQKRVETFNFEIRKQLLEYDNVMNKQREVIYNLRRAFIEGENTKDFILESVEDTVAWMAGRYLATDGSDKVWDIEGLSVYLKAKFDYDIEAIRDQFAESSPKDIQDLLYRELVYKYNAKEEEIGTEHIRHLERIFLLHTIDAKWKDHLYAMDQLKEGVGLRALGQRDPLIEYKREGFHMFQTMYASIHQEVAEMIFKVQPAGEERTQGVFNTIPQNLVHQEFSGLGRAQSSQRPAQPAVRPEGPARIPTGPSVKPVISGEKKVGRNDPCPCGSGKKYKKCCGA